MMSEVDEVGLGDWRNIDDYVSELQEAGYDAEYENLWSGSFGFTAELTIDGEVHAVFEGGSFGHLVKDVTPLSEF